MAEVIESAVLAPTLLCDTLRWQFRRYLPDTSKVLVITPNRESWVFDGEALIGVVSNLIGKARIESAVKMD